VGTEAVNAELSPARRKLRGSDLLDFARHISIIAVGRYPDDRVATDRGLCGADASSALPGVCRNVF
jgi:hypothetical protein